MYYLLEYEAEKQNIFALFENHMEYVSCNILIQIFV